ncbi:MAG: formylglycine-generating enzyme family protein [Polyangiaceae bacterium]
MASALGFLPGCSGGSGAESRSVDAGRVMPPSGGGPGSGGSVGCIPVADAGSRSSQGGDSGWEPPSCAAGGPGLTNCGAGSESCCTSLDVPGGTYYAAYSNLGGDGGPTDESAPATVSSFYLDKYLVTVGRFRQFANAWDNACWRPSVGSGKHWYVNGGKGLADEGDTQPVPTYERGWVATDEHFVGASEAYMIATCNGSAEVTWTSSPGDHENLPINCVSWADAYAFCIWDGGFLPSEAEWEYAAAGGSEERTFPWGSTPPGPGNQYAISNCDYPSGLGLCTGATNIAPVGTATLGAGRWGQLDLAGEMQEWNIDWYVGSLFEHGCVDCAYTTQVAAYGNRVTRGGDFADPTSYVIPPLRDGDDPRFGDAYTGFRCARPPLL